MNWPLIIIFAIAMIILVYLLVRRNLKDEKEFEKQLDEDYPKPKDSDSDIEIDEKMK